MSANDELRERRMIRKAKKPDWADREVGRMTFYTDLTVGERLMIARTLRRIAKREYERGRKEGDKSHEHVG